MKSMAEVSHEEWVLKEKSKSCGVYKKPNCETAAELPERLEVGQEERKDFRKYQEHNWEIEKDENPEKMVLQI